MPVHIHGIEGIPEIAPGDDLAAILLEALRTNDLPLQDQDVVVIAQKVVSKAEGRLVRLADVTPSARAHTLADALGKDPALVEVILGESRSVVKSAPRNGRTGGVLITEHRLGFVMANAGVDSSNAPEPGVVVLLPEAPDESAERIRAHIAEQVGVEVGVVIIDTFGRPWRAGLVNVAIGVAGMPTRRDLRGQVDPTGRALGATVLAVADEIAAATGLVIGKLNRVPVAVVRGMNWTDPPGRATDLVRPVEEDLFR